MGVFFEKNKKNKNDYTDTLSSFGKDSKIINSDTLSRSDTSNSFSSDRTTASIYGMNRNTITSESYSLFNKKLNSKGKLEWATNLQIAPLSILASVFFISSVFSFSSHQGIQSEDIKQNSYLSQAEKSAEIISKQTLLMKNSLKPVSSLESLEKEKISFSRTLGVLEFGGSVDGIIIIKPLSGDSLLQLKQLKKDWAITESTIDEIIKQKAFIINSKYFISYLKEQSNIIASNTSNLQATLQNKDPIALALASMITTSVYKSLNDIIGTEISILPENKKNLLADELSKIAFSLNSLKAKHSDSNEINDAFKNYEKSIEILLNKNKVLENISYLNKTNELLSKLLLQAQNVTESLEPINRNMNSANYSKNYLFFLSITLSVFGTLTILLIAISLYSRSIKTLRLANGFKKNQSNEKALNELLSQIEPLDSGDFTKTIFIEDKFLINLSKRIDNTRILFGETIKQMKESSANILSSADSTEQNSQKLAEISNRQFKKLAESILNINEITNSIDEIAQSTWIAQDESNRSVQESEKGENLVSQSIKKMSEIRNTIQESSKKIKKLGESAQSITEVTSLIKDITKQINILALNAAIQAASSGESGREFTVVAQEVQRLADDSESATKKIEELINEIQSDTAVAIASMEKTTQEVVNGAQLTEQAGVALKAINELSKNTAEQIMSASAKLEQKSAEMAAVTFEMQGLQQISQESQNAVNITTTQVEALKKISENLEDTFKQYKV